MAAHSLVKAVMSWASTILLMLFIVVFTILLWSINEMSYIYFYRKKKVNVRDWNFSYHHNLWLWHLFIYHHNFLYSTKLPLSNFLLPRAHFSFSFFQIYVYKFKDNICIIKIYVKKNMYYKFELFFFYINEGLSPGKKKTEPTWESIEGSCSPIYHQKINS
jgi:hypothetical protein